MKTTMIKWHNVKTDGLPKESGEYLVCKYWGGVTVLPYSSNHKKFNVLDCDDENRAIKNEIEVTYWAELPTLD